MSDTPEKVVTLLALTALSAEFVIGDRIIKTLTEPVTPHIETAVRPDEPMLDLNVASTSGNAFNVDSYRLSVDATFFRDPTNPVGQLAIFLRATPHASFYNDRQEMYGRFSTVEQLTSALGRILPRRQLRSIRQRVLAGRSTEIGGSRSGVIRVFSAKTLREIGMSFRPVERA